MAITIKFDSANNPLPSRLILATKSGNRIRELPISNVKFRDSFLNGSEFSFNVFKNHCVNKSGEVDEAFWRRIVDFKIAYCPEFDMWYEIHLDLEESDETIKSCTAVSLAEAELSQINVYGIEVNTEADIARADYKPTVLFDPEDKDRSLVDRLLYKAPHYSVKHVDYTIANIQRSFSFNDTSILDAYQEIATEFNCLFIVEARKGENSKIERTISIYDLENYCLDCHNRGEFSGACDKCGSTNIKYGYGDDTSIFVSRKNLAQEINYSTDVDSVKNCFRLEGGDDLMTATIINCNPNGSQYLWYITDAMKSDMSDALRERLDAYDDLYAAYQNTESYSPPANLRTQYNEIVNRYKSVKSDLEEIPENIIGFPALMTAYYNTIDLQMFLNNSMMPNIATETTDAAQEAAKLTVTNLSPVAVANLAACTESTAASAVLSVAKCFVRGSFQVKVKNSSYNSETYLWTGNFEVTNYSDEEDVAASPTVSVLVVSDLETFVKQKIKKMMAQQSDDPTSVSALFDLELADFKTELKKYSLQRLIAFRDVCQVSLDIMIQQGLADRKNWVSSQNNLYDNMYLPYYNKMSAIEDEIYTRTTELSVVVGVYDENNGILIDGMQSTILAKRNEIQDLLNFEKYLGDELWLELASFRREDTFTNKNFISDGLNNEEIFTRAEEFINLAQKEIYRSAVLQHSITSTLSNLLTMHEFLPIVDKFAVGNWLRIEIDGIVYRLRLIEYTIDYDSWKLSSVSFSDVRQGYSSASDIQNLLSSLRSMSSSYGSVSRQAQAGKKSQDEMESWVTDGFKLTSQKIVGGAANQEFEINESGITGREYIPETEGYKDEQVKIISSGLYVTDDGWLTAKAGVGRFQYYNPDSKRFEEAYGVIADTIVGNLVLSREVGIYNEGSSIKLDENGFTMIADATNNTKVFTIMRQKQDGTLENVLSLDSNGNLLLNSYSTTEQMNMAISTSAEGIETEFTKKLENYDTSEQVTSKIDKKAGEILTTISRTYITSNDAASTYLTKSNGISSVVIEYAVGDSPENPPSDESEWSSETPSWTEGRYVWQRTKTINGNNQASYSNATCIQGADGINGYNTATVYLYKRAQAAPTIDWATELTYSFDSHTLTTVPTGWSQTVPSGTDPLYVTSATAMARTNQAAIPVSAWVRNPVLLVKNGDDAYTVILTNDNHTFPGDTGKAIASQIDCYVVGYKGNTQMPVTIGTIANVPTGMTATIYNNGTTSARVNIAVTNQLTVQTGMLSIPCTVDDITFVRVFSFSVALVGRGISAVTEMYKESSSSSVAPEKDEFTTIIPTLSETYPYLWNYEITTYTDGSTPGETERHVIAIFSKDGKGISDIINYYLATNSSSGVTRETSGWDTDVSTQSVNQNRKYLWTYEKTVYTVGDPSYTDPTIIGNYAEDGVAATSYHMLSTSTAVNKSEDGIYTPSSITLTAQSKKGNEAIQDYNGRFKLEKTANFHTWTQVGVVSSSDELSHTWDISELPSNTVALRGTLFLAGGTTTVLDQQTFPIVTDGQSGNDAYTVVLTNENHTFAGSVTKALPSSADCYVVGFNGTLQAPISIGTIDQRTIPTGMTVTISGNGTTSAKFTVAVSDAMETANGTLTIPVSILDNESNVLATFNKIFTYSIAFAGTSATAYQMITSHAAINKSELGAYNPSSITLNAKSQTGDNALQNYAGRFKVETTSDNTTWMQIGISSKDESSFTCNIGSLAQTVIALRCSLYEAGGTTTLIDQQILPIVSDGYSGANTATVFLYQRADDATSAVKPTGTLTYTFASGELSGTLGNWTQSIPASDGKPCFFIQASAISTDDSIDIGSDAWSAVRMLVTDGVNGEDAYTVILSNESHTFAGGTSAAIAATTSCTVTAYKGLSPITPSVVQSEITGLPTGMTATVSSDGKTITFTVTTSMKTRSGLVTIPVRVDDKIFNKEFSYTLALNGAAGISYNLLVDCSSIGKSESGIYSQDTITLTSQSKSGTSAIASYKGRFKIETKTATGSWTTNPGYISSGNESTTTYTVPANIVALRCSLYLAGGTTTLLDQQTVPIVTSGKDSYTVILTNESHTFAGDDEKALNNQSVSCGVIAYKGDTQIAATIGTITGQPTGLTTTIVNNGTTSASITVDVTSSMTSEYGILTVPITVDGKSFSKIFTYSLALAGQKGNDAITYYLIVNNAVVGRTSDGTLNPTSITMMAKSKTGNQSTVNYSGRFRLESTTNNTAWTVVESSSANESSHTFSISGLNSSVVALRGSLYQAGGFTTLIDQQTIPIVVDGTGIESIEDEYYLSTSNTQPTDGSWSTSQPVWEDGKYIWTRSKITYTDGTTANPHVEYTTEVLAKALNGANQTAFDVQSNLTQNYYTKKETDEGVTTTLKSYQKLLDTKADNLITYPYADQENLPLPGGLTITVNEDGSIVVTGTSTANVSFYLTSFEDKQTLPSGPYTLGMGDGAEGASIRWKRRAKTATSGSGTSVLTVGYNADVKTGTVDYDHLNDYIAVYLYFQKGKTYAFTAYPQLEYGETGHNWQPTSRSYQSQITQTSTEIELRVASVEQAVASLGAGNLIPCPYNGKSGTDEVLWEAGHSTPYGVYGINFTIEDDGSITVDGTATSDIIIDILKYSQKYKLATGTYNLSGNASVSGIGLRVYFTEQTEVDSGSTNPIIYYVTNQIDAYTTGGQSFDWPGAYQSHSAWTPDSYVGIRMQISSGASFSNATFKPMLSSGSEASDWASPVNTTTSKVTASESSIRQNANSIAAKVSVGNVAAQLTLECTDGTSTVNLGADRVTINSTCFKLTGTGNVTSSGQFTTNGTILQSDGWPVSADMPDKSVLDAGGLDLYVGTAGSTLADTRIAQYGPAFESNSTTSSPTQVGCGINTKSGAFVGLQAGENAIKVYPSGTAPIELIGGVWVDDALYFSNPTGGTYSLASGRYGSFGNYTYGLVVTGNFGVTAGTKNRLVETNHYGTLALNAMESTYCVFSDLGSGVIDEAGVCYIIIDPDFIETIDLNHDYQVFVTQTSQGNIAWVEKQSDRFMVHGQPGTKFDWIIYARQDGYTEDRLTNYSYETLTAQERALEDDPYGKTVNNGVADQESMEYMDNLEIDYDQLAEQYMEQYESEIEDI